MDRNSDEKEDLSFMDRILMKYVFPKRISINGEDKKVELSLWKRVLNIPFLGYFSRSALNDLKEEQRQHLQSELEKKVAALSATESELKEVKKDHFELTKTTEAYLAKAHKEFTNALGDLRTFYKKVYGKSIDENTLARSVHALLQVQKAAVKEAKEKLFRKDIEVEQVKRDYRLAEANLYLETKKVVVVLGMNNKIENMSKAAENVFGKEAVGKNSEYIAGDIKKIIEYVANTYEPYLYLRNFELDKLGKKNLQVYINRGEDGTYIGSFLIVGNKKISWWKLSKSYQEKLDDVIVQIATTSTKYGRMPFDLRQSNDISDELAERIKGLSKSKRFRTWLKVIVNKPEIYDKLVNQYNVPKDMILDTIDQVKYKEEPGLEGTAAMENI